MSMLPDIVQPLVTILCAFLLILRGEHAYVHATDLAFNELELRHIFGTKSSPTELPGYTVTYPRRHSFTEAEKAEELRYVVEHEDKVYEFQLKSNLRSLLSPSFVARENFGNSSTPLRFTALENGNSSERLCSYTGRSVNHNDAFIALVGCGSQQRGIITTVDDEYLFLHPLSPKHWATHPPSDDARYPHIIHRRSPPTDLSVAVDEAHSLQNLSSEHVCLFNPNEDPFLASNVSDAKRNASDFRRILFSEDRLAVTKGALTVELGIFVDDAMWKHFDDLYGSRADAELLSFILASVNNIHLMYTHRSLDPKVNMVIVRYEVFKEAPPPLNRRIHRSGDVDLLLEAFCDYQDHINPASDTDPAHWDHALLFSGYDLYRGRLKSVAGYAPVKGMCSGDRSCTINEGLDFGAVFVITHEMGHSLGMYHDGDNGCDANCCIMKDKMVILLQSRIQPVHFKDGVTPRQINGVIPENCMLDTPDEPKLNLNAAGLPGQHYSLDQQCRIFHGDCWHHELRDGQTIQQVCNMVWCGEGEGIIRTTHPALEGSWCGENRWCIEGECKPWPSGSNSPAPVNGQWTEWNDNPQSACANGCSECEVRSQLRIRRSIRMCENPAPNYGGNECAGLGVRGLVCDLDKCDGPSPDQYATGICGKLRHDLSVPDLLLSGQGFQYSEAPCRVWCHLSASNFIRAVSNFPDGTPCGTNKFCIKGECGTLACDSKAIVDQHSQDCPTNADIKIIDRSIQTTAAPPSAGSASAEGEISAESSAEREKEANRGWDDWLEWSACSASCGTSGTRSRRRTCSKSAETCDGAATESDACSASELCAAPSLESKSSWTEWQDWSECSRSCGAGSQSRHRNCASKESRAVCQGSPFEYRKCRLGECDKAEEDNWTAWSDWQSCDCDSGQRTRQRTCNAAICLGGSTESEDCHCKGVFSDWGPWSECSVTCGHGVTTRRRQCSSTSESDCADTLSQTKDCSNQRSCHIAHGHHSAGDWSSWSRWTSCDNCHNGAQFRKRVCEGNRICTGKSIEYQSCKGSAACQESRDDRVELLTSGEISTRSTRNSASLLGGERSTAAADSAEAKSETEKDDVTKEHSDDLPESSDDFSEWTQWSACSESCDGKNGVSLRRRHCSRSFCSGNDRELRQCTGSVRC